MAKAAQKEAASSSSAAPAKAEGGENLMKIEEDSLKRLRQKCSNTLWVAAAILSRDGLQELARLTRMFVGPFLDQHSQNEREVRGPAATEKWYLLQAQGAWVEVLDRCVSKLASIPELAWLGFDVAFSAVPDGLATSSSL
eukprot:7646958-Lingulodinium_polyedra.AAC.1